MISSQELEDKIKLLQQQLEEAQKKMVNIGTDIHVCKLSSYSDWLLGRGS